MYKAGKPVREPFKTYIWLFALLILASSLAAAGQTRAVWWSADPRCGFHTSNFDPKEKLTCSIVETPRGPVSAVSVGGVALAVVFAEDGVGRTKVDDSVDDIFGHAKSYRLDLPI